MKLLSESELLEELLKYQYFSDERHTCILPFLFLPLFVHKYGGFMNDWKKWIDKDRLYMENVSGFTYVFPLTREKK